MNEQRRFTSKVETGVTTKRIYVFDGSAPKVEVFVVNHVLNFIYLALFLLFSRNIMVFY